MYYAIGDNFLNEQILQPPLCFSEILLLDEERIKG